VSNLVNLEELIGTSFSATDGNIGKIDDFLFDDRSWRIRFFVVDVGNWLGIREVVVPVEALGKPDWGSRHFVANHTREQVRKSPKIDAARPVYLQQEIALKEYYGWPHRWGMGGPPELPPVHMATGEELPPPSGDDPHLRSVQATLRYRVWSEDGLIGTLEHYIVDEASWHIGYLDLRAGDWLRRRSVLMPTKWVESISWGQHTIRVAHQHRPAA